MNKKEMSERISLEECMKHEYFAGIDFDNLPAYQQALSEMTPFEENVSKLCQHLIEKYMNVSKDKVEVREATYKNEIRPFIEKQVQLCPEDMR
jgi:hypothetical protein